MSSPDSQTILSVEDLRVQFRTSEGLSEVVQGVNLSVAKGEKVALVGESGSGKSVTARAIMRLDQKACLYGSVKLSGEELVGASDRKMRSIRGRDIGLVFQDPLTSLNPVMTIGWQVTQPLIIRGVAKKTAKKRAIELLEHLGVRDAEYRYHDYPHQFSGGMRQRVVIAIAIISGPQILIADEPTTALDVTVQAQVLDLISKVTEEQQMGVLLITHDLGIVANFADRVAVMRNGRIVEENTVDRLYRAPAHPYTKGLLGAIPRLNSDPTKRLATVADYSDDSEMRPTVDRKSDKR